MRTGTGIMLGLMLLATTALAWKLCHAPKPTAVPSLSQQWHDQVYSLDEYETVRFVAPPFSPLRMQRNLLPEKQLGLVVYSKDKVYSIVRSSKQRDDLIREGYPWWWSIPWHGPARDEYQPRSFADVQAGIEFCALGIWPDIMVSAELKSLPADGDWIVRGTSPLHRRLEAGRSILSSLTGRPLLIRYAQVEREVDEYWSLCLDDQAPLKIIRDTRSVPAVYLVDAAANER